VGLLCIEDAETGEVVELDTSDQTIRENYAAQANRRRDNTARKIRSRGIDLVECVNGDDWMAPLLGFFQNRRQRTG
jgi:hypothetical protein